MDGVTVAASLIGIAAAGCQISIKLVTLATQISTASDRVTSIGNDVSLTSGVLQQLGELMSQKATSDGTSIFSQGGLEVTRTSATMCERIFQEVDQMAKSASRQIRETGKVTGQKIKLSKSEKLKWPFLQPNMESLRTDLREAKGTLMLMLQVTSLAFERKMADLHESMSKFLVEQGDVVNAILALQKEQQMNKRPISPSPPNNKSEMNELGMTPNSRSSEGPPPKRRMTSQDTNQTESEPMMVLYQSPVHTPLQSIENERNDQNALNLFLLNPVVKDVDEVIELSWQVHRAQMQQSHIFDQFQNSKRNGTTSFDKVLASLHDHEHNAIKREIRASSGADDPKLVSLERSFSDIRHREITFKDVPSLHFILKREPSGGIPVPASRRTRNGTRHNALPLNNSGRASIKQENVEITTDFLKSLNFSTEDPCSIVLPRVLEKYNRNIGLDEYDLYIICDKDEHKILWYEQPLVSFQKLDKQGKKPMFMLRKRTPADFLQETEIYPQETGTTYQCLPQIATLSDFEQRLRQKAVNASQFYTHPASIAKKDFAFNPFAVLPNPHPEAVVKSNNPHFIEESCDVPDSNPWLEEGEDAEGIVTELLAKYTTLFKKNEDGKTETGIPEGVL